MGLYKKQKQKQKNGPAHSEQPTSSTQKEQAISENMEFP